MNKKTKTIGIIGRKYSQMINQIIVGIFERYRFRPQAGIDAASQVYRKTKANTRTRERISFLQFDMRNSEKPDSIKQTNLLRW